VDKFHTLTVFDVFNNAMEKMAEFTNKLYQPFEYFTSGKKSMKYYELPDVLREQFECVKIQKNPENNSSLLIAYSEELGLVAFELLLSHELDGVPENYTLQLSKSAQVQIIHPDAVRETMFLIRAIVKIEDEERDLIIKRNIPVFFAQMKI
jgi:hypothetical protein